MRLDTGARTATLSTKEVVGFRVALVATGAAVRRLRLDGAQLEGIHYLRTLGNSDTIRAAALQAERVLLVGGSYIACEVAATLTALGRRCTMVMLEDAPLSAHFGPTAGEFFGALLRERGVELVCGDGLERLEGDTRVQRAVCASGRELDADMVVMGTGAMPDVMLARAAGLELGETGGVACSADLETSVRGIWAAGDMCEYDSVLHGGRVRIEHFEVACAQGRAAAEAMLGTRRPYSELPYFWTDLSDWCTAEWVGITEAPEQEVVRGSVEDGAFSVLHLAGGRLVAALSVGRGEDLAHARRLIASGADLAGREAELAGGDLDAL
jgi:3-phenylpropionate/trans-cinnamate dioxygenase ferredoxin reductase subunit